MFRSLIELVLPGIIKQKDSYLCVHQIAENWRNPELPDKHKKIMLQRRLESHQMEKQFDVLKKKIDADPFTPIK